LKRVYFRDFALRNALCIKKDFNKLFANLVFCELLKLKKKLSYDKNFDFILKDEKIAFVASLPLLDVDLLILKAKKLIPKALEANIFHIVFISLSNENSFYESGVKVEILPFENWALSL
ncbi:MAG TPA: ATP-binding protein, partial [Campylobacter avium]|nr:ATP-binding protein [Campylobacter avium]